MVHNPLVIAALSAGLLSPLAAGMYSSSSPVIQLTSKNFEEKILKSNHASIVEFYAPWCGHCKNLKPAYEKAAENLKGLAQVAAIDCDEDSNKQKCAEFGVQGFPTIKTFKPGKKFGKPSVQDYQGARSAKGIVDFVLEQIPNHVTRVNSNTVNEFLQKNNETAKAILFTKKGVATPMYKALAIDYLGAITFAQVRDKETEALAVFGIEKFPTLVVLPGGDAEGAVYDGEMKKEPMSKFLSKYAKPVDSKPAKEEKTAKESSTSTTTSVPPKPTFDATIPEVPSMNAFEEQCGRKICVLIITPPVAPVLTPFEKTNAYINQAKLSFPFFQLPWASLSPQFKDALDLKESETPQMRAVSIKKGWSVEYKGDLSSHEEMEGWIDALKLGDLPKKKFAKLGSDVVTPPEPAKEAPKHEEL
ncbi:hypothetical protein AA313_de0203732 [Arthrobotrys entomopaga]|nr:hypothetical protein AA313_de0203732 [Arthrobotrys entomopaga]